jgi:hypothetical protein
MERGTRGEASLHVQASPERLYDLVADVGRMAEWSPECRACEWIDEAAAPVVGARFRGTNRRGLARWTTELRVVAADRGREFAFVTVRRGHEQTRWSYRLAPHGGGTTVTESFELLADMPWYLVATERVLMGVADRRADLEAGMRTTLRRLKAAAETRNTSDAPREAAP